MLRVTRADGRCGIGWGRVGVIGWWIVTRWLDCWYVTHETGLVNVRFCRWGSRRIGLLKGKGLLVCEIVHDIWNCQAVDIWCHLDVGMNPNRHQ